MSRIKQHKTKFIVGILVLIAAGWFIFGRNNEAKSEEADQGPVIDVSTITVNNVDAPVYRESPGTVRPRMESEVAAKIMSTVSVVYVKEGDYVKAGQTLVRLEASDLAAQKAQARAELRAANTKISSSITAVQLQKAQSSAEIESAKAALQMAKEQLAVAQSGPRKQERSQAKLAIVQAEAQLKNAETDYNRMKKLFDQDVIPRQRLDSAETAYEVAKAQFEAAKEQSSLVEEGTRQEDIRTAQEKVRQAEEALRLAIASSVRNKMRIDETAMARAQASQAAAGLRQASVQQAYATVKAPISGLVTRRLVDPGDMVGPQVPLLVVEEAGNYRLEATVPESLANSLYAGKRVEIAIDTIDKKWVDARVIQVLPSADKQSRTFTVKIGIPAGISVRSGQFGRLRFQTGKEKSIFVPASVLIKRDGLTGVFVIDSGKSRYRLVKAVEADNGKIQILSGLNDGDRVVISDTAELADGNAVSVRGY